MNKVGYVYILANRRNGTIYIGVTSNLSQRIEQHKNKLAEGFTKKYSISKLVYYEVFDTFSEALRREKTLKGLLRIKKLMLIEKYNPDWNDLIDTL